MQHKLSYSIIVMDSGSSILVSELKKRNHLAEQVKYFNDIKTLVRSDSSVDFDIILLDFDSASYSGWEVLSYLRSTDKTKHIPVIVLTEMDDETTEVQALNNGAKDFIVKPFSVKKLLARIEANVVINHALVAVDLDLPEAPQLEKKLTSREIEILTYIINGYTNRQIAEKAFITTLTAANHIKSILKKLNVQNRTQAVIVAIKNNLVHLNF